NADALAEWAVVDDGKRVAYGVQTGGTDWRTIRVLNVDTGEVLDDEVQWARITQIAWTKDGSGFFYSRYPEPEGRDRRREPCQSRGLFPVPGHATVRRSARLLRPGATAPVAPRRPYRRRPLSRHLFHAGCRVERLGGCRPNERR